MQIVIDFTKAGLLPAIRRFISHAVLVALVAGAADLIANLQNVSFSTHTAEAAVGLALITSALHNGLIWLQTRADKTPVVEQTVSAGEPALA